MTSPIQTFQPQGQTPHKPVYTFVLRDSGETLGLEPVMRALEAQGTDYAIISEPGSSARKILKSDPHLAPTPAEVLQANASNPPLARIGFDKLIGALNAKLVISGMVSDFQAGWAQWFASQQKRVFGFFDSFQIGMQSPGLMARFRNTLSRVLAPSDEINRRLQKHFPGKVSTVGHPVLDTHQAKVGGTNAIALAQRLKLDPNKQTLVFVGSYGEAYQQAFQIFAQALPALASRYNVLISLHPSQTGFVERQLLRQAGLSRLFDMEMPERELFSYQAAIKANSPDGIQQPSVQIIPSDISTEELLSCSQGVIAPYPSTMAVQALFANRHVFLIKPPSQPRTLQELEEFDPVVAYRMGNIITSPEALVTGVPTALAQQPPGATRDLHSEAGIPFHATERVLDHLIKEVAHSDALEELMSMAARV